jgi:hypothetical protein
MEYEVKKPVLAYFPNVRWYNQGLSQVSAYFWVENRTRGLQFAKQKWHTSSTDSLSSLPIRDVLIDSAYPRQLTLDQSSFEANSRSPRQEIATFYGTRRCITVFTRSCSSSAHSLTSRYFEVRFNIVLRATSVACRWSLSLTFCMRFVSHACYMIQPSVIFLNMVTLTIFVEFL